MKIHFFKNEFTYSYGFDLCGLEMEDKTVEWRLYFNFYKYGIEIYF